MPTILDILGVRTKLRFDGRSLWPEMNGKRRKPDTEFYLTECTWMRKHGWRTPEWKYIHALEPDFHFKKEVELYNLIDDPEEAVNLAAKEPKLCEVFEERIRNWIAKREKATGRRAPILTQAGWHGCKDVPDAFQSSQQAYDTLHIGNPKEAQRIQALAREQQQKAGKA
jgi:hypothetical protein